MEKKSKRLKGLIIGFGSIGQRHFHNLKKLGIEMAVCDVNKNQLKKVPEKLTSKKFHDLDSALLFTPDFSVICTFPDTHIDIANKCLKANSHVFIEKPISNSLIDVEKTLQYANHRRLKVAIGYNMRFDPGLNLMKKLLQSNNSIPLSVQSQWGLHISKWQPRKSFEHHYALKKGNEIILDDSHEYDYLRWMLEDEVTHVYCQTNKMKLIKTETESVAIINLRFRKGTIGTIMMDYVRPNYERSCYIITKKSALKWKFILDSAKENYQTRCESIIKKTNITSKSQILEKFKIKLNDMYTKEIIHFLHCITNNNKPIIDGYEGLKTLRIGLAAIKSSRENRMIRL